MSLVQTRLMPGALRRAVAFTGFELGAGRTYDGDFSPRLIESRSYYYARTSNSVPHRHGAATDNSATERHNGVQIADVSKGYDELPKQRIHDNMHILEKLVNRPF
eukprot:3497696-Pleurochrysis_carterae.AAC.1